MDRFDWVAYLKLATRLSGETDEAALRSAISRAYYYIFHLALARAEANAYVPPKATGSHNDLWALYKDSPILECKQLGQIGRRIQQARVLADYDDNFPRLELTARTVLVDATAFANKLAQVHPRHPQQLSQRR